MKQGVMAIAWDEGIGRIFFATSHDTRLYILDVAKAPKEDQNRSEVTSSLGRRTHA
ncbi:hypothetical protein SERLADRAFT_377093 [Serpula lacrymans var. lacrymans S7.9]|uniref:Anaphase-promoting complex subunit 4 WD40 domain-containing protein n=1 Tax=Serpula lacrymans var. lacrymans (strain S7.9) TaxID=578457 RepID=F8NFI7_SERL9|nr:uncharacterized protein SERLADRAFT_377093 [Serpula lacrymans var. lacrymans S7.9]EGO31231.1 hypothetical protein SERLADRAFT_377093 [Serpula lacrymans var. lacrymans S7.9]